jgi:murein DD-endopeptidase MepM/ murein hydrolase activator NlpD
VIHIPHKTKIMIMPMDGHQSKELVISRRLMIALISSTISLILLVLFCLISYSAILRQAQLVPSMREQLESSTIRLASVEQINIEIEEMRAMQEKLLGMLGVNPDSVVWAGDSQIKKAIMAPPPEMWPVDGTVTRDFIIADKPNGIVPHLGIDFTAPIGTPIVSAGKGVVQQAGFDEFLGNFVEIRHGFGYVTVYGHCGELTTRAGDLVNKGQMIGTLGGTGKVTAPHLHFEIWVDGEAVDPGSVIQE